MAVHSSAPDIAGQGVANPMALMRSAVLMLKHLALEGESGRLAAALRQVVVRDKVRTRDLGGTFGTDEFTGAVVRATESSG